MQQQEPSDEDLALGVQAGDRADLAQLVRRHHEPLLGYLYRRCGGDRLLAEDLVQDTFLRVWQRRDQYRYPARFKPWLYAIATNLARDYHKQADQRRGQPADTGWLRAQPGAAALPEARLQQQDDDARVAAAVAALPAGQQETLLLRYYQGFSLADIATILDIPVGTVKSRLSLALKRLRRQLLENPDV